MFFFLAVYLRESVLCPLPRPGSWDPLWGKTFLLYCLHGICSSVYSVIINSHHLREGNGNPLQYACLENPMDRGDWQATVHGVAKSWTNLSEFIFLTFLILILSQRCWLDVNIGCSKKISRHFCLRGWKGNLCLECSKSFHSEMIWLKYLWFHLVTDLG